MPNWCERIFSAQSSFSSLSQKRECRRVVKLYHFINELRAEVFDFNFKIFQHRNAGGGLELEEIEENDNRLCLFPVSHRNLKLIFHFKIMRKERNKKNGNLPRTLTESHSNCVSLGKCFFFLLASFFFALAGCCLSHPFNYILCTAILSCALLENSFDRCFSSFPLGRRHNGALLSEPHIHTLGATLSLSG